jgi:hypothetical protein
MLRNEVTYMPAVDCFRRQRELAPAMRPLLNDWLSDLCEEFAFRRETLFLAVNIVDRYLSKVQVSRQRLQLIGAAATLIAAKFEEVYEPSLDKLSYLMDSAFSIRDITLAECSVLSQLGWQVSCPTAAHFLSQFVACSNANGSASRCAKIAWQILDMALLDECSVRCLPSRLALSALSVACRAANARYAPELFASFLATNNFEVAFDALGLNVELEACELEMQRLLNAGLRRPLEAVRRQRAEQGTR